MRKGPGGHNDATELGFDRTDLIAHLRIQFATELELESKRLRDLGWDEVYIEQARVVYLHLRSDLRTHASALAGITVYLEAIRNGVRHEIAFAQAMKVQPVVPTVMEDEAATILHTGSPASVVVDASLLVPAADQTTLQADASNFGVQAGKASSDATLAVADENFGIFPDSTLKVVDARARIATALSFDLKDLEPSVQRPALIKSVPEPVVPAVVVNEERQVVKLDKKQITAHMAACKATLTEEAKQQNRADFAEEGAQLYGILLAKGESSASAMTKVRVFCRQRQLGAEPGSAALAAANMGPLLPEHDEFLDTSVEAALREQKTRGLSRGWIAAIIIGGTVVVGVIATAAYMSSCHTDQHPDTQTIPNP